MKTIHNFTRRAVLVAVLAASAVALPVQAGQPHMEAALASLRQARAELEAAEHDKAGFRVKAIKDIQRVIDDIKIGMAAGR